MADNELSMEERVTELSRIMNEAFPTFDEAAESLSRIPDAIAKAEQEYLQSLYDRYFPEDDSQ